MQKAWIRQEITRAIALKSRTIKVPIHLSDRLIQIKTTQRKLEKTLGRCATMAEIAEAMGVEPVKLRDCLSAFRQPVSLDRPMGNDEEIDFLEIIPSQGITPDERLVQQSFRQEFAESLALLKPIQRQVLMLSFGFASERRLTAKQIAQQLNITPIKVRSLGQQAKKVLRRQQDQMREYLA